MKLNKTFNHELSEVAIIQYMTIQFKHEYVSVRNRVQAMDRQEEEPLVWSVLMTIILLNAINLLQLEKLLTQHEETIQGGVSYK